jgi:hypothetical protein
MLVAESVRKTDFMNFFLIDLPVGKVRLVKCQY